MKNMIIMLAVLMSSNVFANYCATIYQGQDLTGASMDIAEGEEIRNLGELLMDPYEGSDWDNKISSVVVNSECRLVTYQYQNLGRDWDTNKRIGEKRVYKARGIEVRYIEDLHGFDNKISSLKCKCSDM